MFMHKAILLAGLVLALGNFVPGSALAGPHGSNLPFRGTSAGDFTLNLTTGQAHVIGTFPVMHFGLATVDQHLQLVPTGQTTYNFFGGVTITAANGDEMRGTVTGTGQFLDASQSKLVGTYVATSSTGRFADATLTFVTEVMTTRVSVENGIVTGVFTGTFDGQLSW